MSKLSRGFGILINGGSERAWMPGLFGEAWMLDPGDERSGRAAPSYSLRRSRASAAAACSAAFFERPEPLPMTSPSTLAETSKHRS